MISFHLKTYGVKVALNSLLENYFQNREQTVLNGLKSFKWLNI